MKTYLKSIFRIIFITGLAAIPAQADPPPAAQAAPPAAPAAPAQATAPAGTAPVQQPAAQAGDTAPVQPGSVPPVKQLVYYNYAHDESEYSVMLPEAPTVKTLWAASPETAPFVDNPPTDNAAIGELATFKRVDIDTEEVFDVKITFIKAKKSFLNGLGKDKIKDILIKQYKDTPLSNEQFNISPGKGPLRWATLSGFSLDSHSHPSFCAMHYLTGQQSVLVVQVMYSIENKTFQDYYDHLVKSITYVAP